MAHKYDYLRMERDYISRTPEPSVRQIAIDHGIPSGSYSGVQTYARKNDWHGKWLRRNTRTEELVEERIASQASVNAMRELDVRNNAVELIDEAIASARDALKERHYVKEHDEDGADIWVERAKHPVTIPQIDNLLGRLATVFGGQMPSGGGNEQGADISTGIRALIAGSGGGVDFLVGLASAARRGAGEPEPRRVGAGQARDAAAAGED